VRGEEKDRQAEGMTNVMVDDGHAKGYEHVCSEPSDGFVHGLVLGSQFDGVIDGLLGVQATKVVELVLETGYQAILKL
jgi:hypothetical protein